MKKKLVNELNLKGEVCPMTFVKTKLAIESLNSGERLKVFFNDTATTEIYTILFVGSVRCV